MNPAQAEHPRAAARPGPPAGGEKAGGHARANTIALASFWKTRALPA